MDEELRTFESIVREMQGDYEYFIDHFTNSLRKVEDVVSNSQQQEGSSQRSEDHFLVRHKAYRYDGKIRGSQKRATFFTREAVFNKLLSIHNKELVERLGTW